MSRNAIGHRDNGKILRDSVVVPLRKILVIEDQPTSACPQTEVLEIFDDSAFCRHSMIITITMRLNRDKEDKELWLRVKQKKEFADLHELFEKIFCIPDASTSAERVFSTSGLSMQRHSARVGNKLLNELLMIKSNIKPQPVYSRMFH